MHRYRSTRKDSPFSRHFLRGHGAFQVVCQCDQDLALTVRIRDLNAGLVGFRFLLHSGLHVAEAPRRAARDVDDAALLVTTLPVLVAEGRLAATWAGNLDAARA